MATKTTTLRSGAQMPMLGLGTYRLGADGSDTLGADRAALETALDLGYRHIDTATAYHNEAFIGEVLGSSGIDRAELFLTSKLRNADHAEGEWRGALERSLDALRTDYLDLYMIHWPLPEHDRYLDAFAKLARARDEGLIRDVGVANFLTPHLDRLVSETGEAPAVDQIEFHPSWHNPDTFARCAELGVVVEAYSPLSRGADFDAEPVAAAAAAHGVPASQVVLAWALRCFRSPRTPRGSRRTSRSPMPSRPSNSPPRRSQRSPRWRAGTRSGTIRTPTPECSARVLHGARQGARGKRR